MKRCTIIILMFNTFCAYSQIPHELVYFVGCFVNGTTQVHFEFDTEEIYFVDFQKEEFIYTVPVFIDPDPNQIWASLELKDTLDNKHYCLAFTALESAEEKNPPEKRDSPDTILFPSEEVQLGVKNRLICFVNYFYPPSIKVSWTKNGGPVSEGVSLSRYFPNNDGTFHQFSTLTFTPSEGDVYSCTVEHSALETPQTSIWEPDVSDHSLGPDIFCGVGLTLGLLMFTAGVFLIVKGQNQH
ncbi:H-2 class II histocompatibility antigen, A-U alpha chain-like isoform X1 [Anabas testudineus]|uniref:Ig-like domain-containing protein n=1 Tax=Anabas testudineus TaxID=64144 RepID=A0A3Q1I9A3_ANATE|nr:H-2 class II histocompatibility antigen, A-U alpha chain-like isoform X1 [Anabas testudineus]XP_026228597.1 H-2 class II histocompatibility antigen, A-U alpha chain-like isoform X1 [Anabas testudineus]